MPYIESISRPYLDEVVKCMEDHSIDATGDLNYVLHKFCKRNCNTYQQIKNFIAELNETQLEIRRRMMLPHEDRKREENGDVSKY